MSNKITKIEGQLPLEDWLKTPIKIGSTLAEIDKKIITEIYTAFHFHGGKNLSYREQIDMETFFESSNNEDKFIIHCEVSETKLRLELIDGYVTSITLLNFLQKIGIDPTTQIEDVFGESDEIKDKTYYYFDRDFEVDTYGHIRIGCSKTCKYFTAIDLLEAYLLIHKYKLSTPEELYWDDNKYTLRRIHDVTKSDSFYEERNFFALLAAFELLGPNGTADNFWSGEFISKRSEADYSAIIKSALEFLQSLVDEKYVSFHLRAIEFCFRMLLRHVIDVESIFERSLQLENSITWLWYPQDIIQTSKEKIRESLVPAKTILCQIIDPYNKRFSLKEMVKNFGYYNVDPRRIAYALESDECVPEDLMHVDHKK